MKHFLLYALLLSFVCLARGAYVALFDAALDDNSAMDMPVSIDSQTGKIKNRVQITYHTSTTQYFSRMGFELALGCYQGAASGFCLGPCIGCMMPCFFGCCSFTSAACGPMPAYLLLESQIMTGNRWVTIASKKDDYVGKFIVSPKGRESELLTRSPFLALIDLSDRLRPDRGGFTMKLSSLKLNLPTRWQKMSVSWRFAVGTPGSVPKDSWAYEPEMDLTSFVTQKKPTIYLQPFFQPLPGKTKHATGRLVFETEIEMEYITPAHLDTLPRRSSWQVSLPTSTPGEHTRLEFTDKIFRLSDTLVAHCRASSKCVETGVLEIKSPEMINLAAVHQLIYEKTHIDRFSRLAMLSPDEFMSLLLTVDFIGLMPLFRPIFASFFSTINIDQCYAYLSYFNTKPAEVRLENPYDEIWNMLVQVINLHLPDIHRNKRLARSKSGQRLIQLVMKMEELLE